MCFFGLCPNPNCNAVHPNILSQQIQDVESMSTTSVTRGNINRPSGITTCYFYKTVFSGILPLKSKIRINVIPSPGFKIVVLIGFCDDSLVFLNIFLNGHNIKRVRLCSILKNYENKKSQHRVISRRSPVTLIIASSTRCRENINS